MSELRTKAQFIYINGTLIDFATIVALREPKVFFESPPTGSGRTIPLDSTYNYDHVGFQLIGRSKTHDFSRPLCRVNEYEFDDYYLRTERVDWNETKQAWRPEFNRLDDLAIDNLRKEAFNRIEQDWITFRSRYVKQLLEQEP